jgi:hypothetical protein
MPFLLYIVNFIALCYNKSFEDKITKHCVKLNKMAGFKE